MQLDKTNVNNARSYRNLPPSNNPSHREPLGGGETSERLVVKLRLIEARIPSFLGAEFARASRELNSFFTTDVIVFPGTEFCFTYSRRHNTKLPFTYCFLGSL